MASLVEIRGLVYEYPRSRALHDLSATIEKGTITALVGPNGAGKTTFLRCLAALEAPYSGTIKLDGLNIHSDPRLSHTQMGYLSDFPKKVRIHRQTCSTSVSDNKKEEGSQNALDDNSVLCGN